MPETVSQLDDAIRALARLPGLGPRSARRIVLELLTRQEGGMQHLINKLQHAAESVRPCRHCGNLDTTDPCRICADPGRDNGQLCIVARISDVWALERSSAYRGRYHVLGGVLSALDGVRPENLNVANLHNRIRENSYKEIILALPMSVDAQATAHWIRENHIPAGTRVSQLARGVPMGGELDYLDPATLAMAVQSRRQTEEA